MPARVRLVTGQKITFTCEGDSPARDYTPDEVWQVRQSGQIVLGRAIVRIGERYTVIDYDYECKTWSQVSHWHMNVTPESMTRFF